jgi:hypothetical protein
MGGSANTGAHGELYEKNIVHECCHIWQYHHVGTRYVADCIWNWATLPGQGYLWEDQYKSGVNLWQDLSAEAQAKFIEDVFNRPDANGVWIGGHQIPYKHEEAEFFEDDPIGANVEFKIGANDHTDFARVSAAYWRSRMWIIANP